MKKAPTFEDLKALAVRHTHIVDRDKVRYRVYRSRTEYIAVIAENALMAMKLSGISNPYKVIRDLLDINTPLAATRMRANEESEQVSFSIAAREDTPESNFVYKEAPELESFFEPMSLAELNKNKMLSQQIVAGESLIKEMHIDPMEYARATRSEDAERISSDSEPPLAATEPVEALAPEPATAPAEATVQEIEAATEPVASPSDDAPQDAHITPAEPVSVPETQEEAITQEATPEAPTEEALPADEIARLLAEPRD